MKNVENTIAKAFSREAEVTNFGQFPFFRLQVT